MDYQQQISVPMSLPDITDKEREAVAKVMATNYLSMGPYVKSFEESFCNFTGAKHAVAVNSGTAGLHLCVQAAGWKDGDRVITTPFSFIASTNCIVYTGTHDNDTTRHWYDTLARKDKSFARRYLDVKHPKDAVNKMIRGALSSVAETAIIPMQDYLEMGGEARMNFPSTLGNNWKWRVLSSQLTDTEADRIYKLCKLYGRAKKPAREI